MIGRIFVGLIIMALGGILVYYSAQLVELVGRNARCEEHLGSTKNAVVLFGFIVVVLGVLIMFGMLQGGSPLNTDV